MLYRELAPISKEAWSEIDQRAIDVLKSYLSARKVVKVNGPKGLNFNVITEGRLGQTENQDDVFFANYKVQPLTEARVEFDMSRWELDNISRGAKDIDFEPLEEGLRKIALFEENAIYNGLEKTGIKGFKDMVEKEEINLGDNAKDIMEAVTKGVISLKEDYTGGPYTLIVGKEAYKRIISKDSGYPLEKRIVSLIGGSIVLSHVLDGAYLIPFNSDDLELTIGRDFSIGYQAHDKDKVKFFIAESFTFRILDPTLIIKFVV